jgi:hypothetical protein
MFAIDSACRKQQTSDPLRKDSHRLINEGRELLEQEAGNKGEHVGESEALSICLKKSDSEKRAEQVHQWRE